MNRELFIMRHAKSDWSQSCSDFDRPLNKRGVRNAKKMGTWIKNLQKIPQQILVSPANRALSTAHLLCDAACIKQTAIQILPEIYHASKEDLYQTLRQVPDKVESVCVIGHNPGIENLLASLSTNDIPLPEDGKLLPTASIAHLTIPTPWSDITPKQGLLHSITRPRSLFNTLETGKK